jgi:4,5-DOPA dioxygenase extradiol
MKSYLLSGDFQKLIDYKNQGKAFELAIPSPEHYLPLIYTLGFKNKEEQIHILTISQLQDR